MASKEDVRVDLATLRERVDRIRGDDLVNIRIDLADFRTDAQRRFDMIHEKLDANRLRTIAVMTTLLISLLLLALNLVLGKI